MDGSKKLEPISIRLDPEVKAILQERAKADSRTLSALVNLILKQWAQSQQPPKKPKAKG